MVRLALVHSPTAVAYLSGSLNIHEHNRLKRLSFSIVDIGTVAPLPDRADGRVRKCRTAFDHPRSRNLPVLIDDGLENHRSLCFCGMNSRGICGWHRMRQSFFRTFGRKKDGGL